MDPLSSYATSVLRYGEPFLPPTTPPKRREQRPLKLLYVQPAECFGGAERQGVLHMSRLSRHGIEVIPVVGPGDRIRSALEEQGVRDYIFLHDLTHEPDGPLPGMAALSFGVRAASDWIATQRHLHEIALYHDVDMVFANRSLGWVAASGVARSLGLPLVWRGGARITSRAEVAVLGVLGRIFRPNLLLANCNAVLDDLLPYVGGASAILNNGVDTERFDPERVAPRFRMELGLGDRPVVGISARPAPEKGIDLLVDVIERVAERHPGVQFLSAGEFGWRQHYEELCARRGLAGRLRFLGHVPDVETFLASCDVIVLGSKAHSIEGSPNALLEAMAMRRPIVATDVGGVGEAIHDGVEGLLVRDTDAAAFADRIDRLLSDEALRRRMGAAGRATVCDRFEANKVVGGLAQMLFEVAAQAGADRGARGLFGRGGGYSARLH